MHLFEPCPVESGEPRICTLNIYAMSGYTVITWNNNRRRATAVIMSLLAKLFRIFCD